MNAPLARSTLASLYFQRFHEFLENADISALRALDLALKRVHPDDIVVVEAEELVQKMRPWLEAALENKDAIKNKNAIRNRTENDSLIDEADALSLQACLLVFRFQLLKPDASWISSSEVTRLAITAFMKIGHYASPEVSENLSLLVEFVIQNKFNDHLHLLYALLGLITQWMFPSAAIKASYTPLHEEISLKCVQLTAESYLKLPAEGRDQILHDCLTMFFRNSSNSSIMVDLVLSLITSSGQIEMHVFKDSIRFNSRQTLDKSGIIKHNESVAVAGTISRKIISFVYQAAKKTDTRVNIENFLTICSQRLLDPNYPAAEIFISAFLSSAFSLFSVYNNQKYPSFLFDVINIFYDALHDISSLRKQDLNEAEDGETDQRTLVEGNDTKKLDVKTICKCIKECSSFSGAVFIASRQLSLPSQPFVEVYDAIQRWNPTAAVESDEWLDYLHQWPISSYFSKTSGFLQKLANSEHLKEKHQAELFRLISKIVSDDPSVFNIKWLNRISYTTPAVCESLASICSRVCSSLSSEDQKYVINKIGSRIVAPGAPTFKRRMFTLLDTLYENKDYTATVWKYMLIGVTDSDSSVRESASNYCTKYLLNICDEELDNENDNSDEKEIYSISLRSILDCVHSDEHLIVKMGLKKFINADFDTNKMQSLVSRLISTNELELASLFVDVNGHFMPTANSLHFFHKFMRSNPNDRLLYLKMLNSMLLARPRVLLSPSITSEIFDSLVSQMKTSTESECDQVSSILQQLVSLGNLSTQERRKNTLKELINRAFNMLKRSLNEDRRLNDTVFCQLVLICGSLKYWESDLAIEIAQTVITMVENDEPGCPRRLITLSSVFGMSINYPELYDNSTVHSFLCQLSGSEMNKFTKLLLVYLWKRPANNSSASQNLQDASKGKNSNVAEINKKRLFAINDEQNQATAILMEQYFEPIMKRAPEDLIALKTVIKAVQERLVAAEQCYPVIMSVCFSNKPALSQTAFLAYTDCCMAYPRIMASKFCLGLKLASKMENTNSIAFPRVWHILCEKQLKPAHHATLISNIAGLLSCSTTFNLLKLIICGLMSVDVTLSKKDAKQLVSEAETNVMMFEPHSERRTIEECTKMILVYVFILWLRKNYGLSVYLSKSRTNEAKSEFNAGESVETEDLQPFNPDYIIDTFNDEKSRDVLGKLMKLPDNFDSKEIQELIFMNYNSQSGKRKLNSEPFTKRRMIDD